MDRRPLLRRRLHGFARPIPPLTRYELQVQVWHTFMSGEESLEQFATLFEAHRRSLEGAMLSIDDIFKSFSSERTFGTEDSILRPERGATRIVRFADPPVSNPSRSNPPRGDSHSSERQTSACDGIEERSPVNEGILGSPSHSSQRCAPAVPQPDISSSRKGDHEVTGARKVIYKGKKIQPKLFHGNKRDGATIEGLTPPRVTEGFSDLEQSFAKWRISEQSQASLSYALRVLQDEYCVSRDPAFHISTYVHSLDTKSSAENIVESAGPELQKCCTSDCAVLAVQALNDSGSNNSSYSDSSDSGEPEEWWVCCVIFGLHSVCEKLKVAFSNRKVIDTRSSSSEYKDFSEACGPIVLVNSSDTEFTEENEKGLALFLKAALRSWYSGAYGRRVSGKRAKTLNDVAALLLSRLVVVGGPPLRTPKSSGCNTLAAVVALCYTGKRNGLRDGITADKGYKDVMRRGGAVPRVPPQRFKATALYDADQVDNIMSSVSGKLRREIVPETS